MKMMSDDQKSSQTPTIQDLEQMCIQQLCYGFENLKSKPDMPRTIILPAACESWYQEHFSQKMLPIIAQVMTTSPASEASKGPVLQAFQAMNQNVNLPSPLEIQERQKASLTQILKSLGDLRNEIKAKRHLTVPGVLVVANYFLTALQKDLNLYRPDFQEWLKSQMLLTKLRKVFIEDNVDLSQLPGEQNRWEFLNLMQQVIKNEEQARFIPFDQGYSLADAILADPESYPPTVWNGVCEAKVLQYLLKNTDALALRIDKDDAKLQDNYISSQQSAQQAYESVYGKIDRKEENGELHQFVNYEKMPLALASELSTWTSHEPFKLGIFSRGAGGHAIAMKKLENGKLSIYDPNLGLLSNISFKIFEEIWNNIYGGSLGYTNYMITEWLPNEEWEQRNAERRSPASQQEEEKQDEKVDTYNAMLRNRPTKRGPQRNQPSGSQKKDQSETTSTEKDPNG